VPYTQVWSGAIAVEATMSDEEFTLAFITAIVVFLVYVIIVIERIK
jgi:hypothetical protein